SIAIFPDGFLSVSTDLDEISGSKLLNMDQDMPAIRVNPELTTAKATSASGTCCATSRVCMLNSANCASPDIAAGNANAMTAADFADNSRHARAPCGQISRATKTPRTIAVTKPLKACAAATLP